VWTDICLGLVRASVGCGSVCVVAQEEQARKVLDVEATEVWWDSMDSGIMCGSYGLWRASKHVWRLPWLSIVGAGCGFVCVVAGEEQVRKVLAE
jgi:hypothetical protein